MYRLRKHRAFYYVFFGDKQISEGMYKQQAEKGLARVISLCYDDAI